MPSSPLKRLISHQPLVAYFVIALAGTWLTILPLLLGQDGLGVFSGGTLSLPFILGWIGTVITATFLYTNQTPQLVVELQSEEVNYANSKIKRRR